MELRLERRLGFAVCRMRLAHVTHCHAAPPGSPQTPEDERRLVKGLVAGDHDAISSFVDRVHRPVYCMANRLIRDLGAPPVLQRSWCQTAIMFSRLTGLTPI